MISTSANPTVDDLVRGLPAGCVAAARAADAKSGEDTVVLAMGELLGLTDAFVITSGRNSRQVRTIVEEIERRVKAEASISPLRIEGRGGRPMGPHGLRGLPRARVLDEAREFYDLEHLWSAAPRVPWDRRVGLRTRAAGRYGPGRNPVASPGQEVGATGA